MARLGILTLHGMGTTKETYADELFEEIADRLGPDLEGRVKTEAAYYQDILHANQKRYFDAVKRKLRWDDLRSFMIHGFGDAASLEAQKDGTGSPYFLAQKKILTAFKSLYDKLEGNDRRVIIVAQSLGGQVISNYLWDALKTNGPVTVGVWSVQQNFDSQEQEDFCRGKNTIRLLTTGCNIPLFVAGIAKSKIKPIKKPMDDFQWHNYYDKDDVLGWPLRDLSNDYAARVTRDHAINAGLLTGFTPLSHQNYWRDRDFLRPLMRHIKQSL